jgi:beta-carotene 15,15'-dioxygenase
MKISTHLIKYLELYIVLMGIGMVSVFKVNAIFDINAQIKILLASIVLVGVPHGALDFLVAEQVKLNQNQAFSTFSFIVKYVFQLSLIAITWYFPVLAMVIFFLGSVFHFGETDLATLGFNKSVPKFVYFLHGTLILSIVILRPLSDLTHALPLLKSSPEIVQSYIAKTVNLRYYVIGIFSVSIVALLSFVVKYQVQSFKNGKFLLYLALLFIVSYLPPLMGLALYFVLWHSLISMRNVWQFSVTKANYSQILLKFIIFSSCSIIGLFLLYFLLNRFVPDSNLFFAILIILSVLTFPHLLEMHNMYKSFSVV